MTATPRIRVLIVDDSAFARKMLRETLSADGRFEVVGFARDGLEALERIAELKPDVMTLDLVMPNLDGIGVLKALPADGAPRVVVVSMADSESELGLTALQLGAVELVHKPTALATQELYELGAELVAKLAAAADARPRAMPAASPVTFTPRAPMTSSRKLLLVGASTGGPQAVTRLLRALPASFPLPIAVVLHMPTGYTQALAARLDEECAIDVVEASEGLRLRPGLAVLARAGVHLKLEEDGEGFRAHLDGHPMGVPHTPSVDSLFESAVAAAPGTIAVVLTGMGDDGTAGARALHAAGAVVLTEAEGSCVVYGMPRSVVEAGVSDEQVPIDRMAEAILRHL